MAGNFDLRTAESGASGELYISATPSGPASVSEQAEEVFGGIRDILADRSARIIEERIFTTESSSEVLLGVRAGVYGDLDDGVRPGVMSGQAGTIGPIAGVQVHAVTGDVGVEPIDSGSASIGRVVKAPGCRLISLSGITAADSGDSTEQARVCLEKAEAALEAAGTDFLSVARTWMWLGDILSWYDDFNHVRNRFFTGYGIIGEGSRQLMPASTGIGLGPADGGALSVDLIAVPEPANSTEYLQAVGRQQCALEYGSAFSRASRAVTPAGKTVFVSGTASIDASGATTNIDDAAGQIKETIENVRAVLRDTGCGDNDVVQALVYSKTAQIQDVFGELRGDLPWPCILMVCDICRADLLFEIEVTAMPGSIRA